MNSVTICLWENQRGLWYWDDAEDHGGFDAISPMGPFDSRRAAMADAQHMFGQCVVAWQDGEPSHYIRDKLK